MPGANCKENTKEFHGLLYGNVGASNRPAGPRRRLASALAERTGATGVSTGAAQTAKWKNLCLDFETYCLTCETQILEAAFTRRATGLEKVCSRAFVTQRNLTVTTRASAPHGPPPGTRPGARALAGLFARQPRTPQRFPENVSHLRDALSQFRDTDSGNPCPPTNFPPSPHSRRQRDAHPQLSTPNPRRDGPLHALYLSPRTRSGWPGPRFHQVLPARIGSRRLAAAERAPDLGPGLLRAAARSPTAPSRSPHRRARPEACGPLR